MSLNRSKHENTEIENGRRRKKKTPTHQHCLYTQRNSQNSNIHSSSRLASFLKKKKTTLIKSYSSNLITRWCNQKGSICCNMDASFLKRRRDLHKKQRMESSSRPLIHLDQYLDICDGQSCLQFSEVLRWPPRITCTCPTCDTTPIDHNWLTKYPPRGYGWRATSSWVKNHHERQVIEWIKPQMSHRDCFLLPEGGAVCKRFATGPWMEKLKLFCFGGWFFKNM